jgi:hypothetical protein
MLTAKQLIIAFFQQFLIVLMVLIVGWVVVASMGEVGEAEAQAPAIVSQDSLARDLAEVQRTYRGQLEEYRLANQQFVVAQQEASQLGTLSSLESAVKATQKVMIIRDQVLSDQVLITYVKMLELELRQAGGVKPSAKDQTLLVLEETTKALTRHLESTKSSVDRQAIAARADDFEALVPLYTFGVDFTRQLLVLAKLRTSYNDAVSIFTTLSTQEMELSSLARDERERALDEINLSLADIDSQLDLVDLEMDESLDKAKVSKSKLLDEIFVKLVQVGNYLDEVHVPTR